MTEFRLLINDSPGVLVRVVGAMRRLGMSLEYHRLSDSNEPGRRELLVAAGGSVSNTDVSQALLRIKGVVEELKTVEPALTPPDTAPEDRDDETDAVVEEIVAAYPKILRHVAVFEEEIGDQEDCSTRLIALGRRVGANLMHGNTAMEGCSSLQDALTITLPVLAPIATATVQGSEIHIRISIFSRRQMNNMDLVFGPAASKCDFMTGMIQGIVNCAPDLSRIGVEETKCRTNGDEQCIFHLA